MFRWATAEELIPPSVHQALAALPGLQSGRTTVHEPKRILPVPDAGIEATRPDFIRTVNWRASRFPKFLPDQVLIVLDVGAHGGTIKLSQGPSASAAVLNQPALQLRTEVLHNGVVKCPSIHSALRRGCGRFVK